MSSPFPDLCPSCSSHLPCDCRRGKHETQAHLGEALRLAREGEQLSEAYDPAIRLQFAAIVDVLERCGE